MYLRARNDIHLARRLWHFFGVMTMFALYWFLPRQPAVIVAVVMSSLMIGFDVLRLSIPRLNRFFCWFFGRFLRKGELRRVSGATSMLAAVTLLVLFYPKRVALLAMLFCAVGDPVASYFGIRFGKDKLIGDKSVQGSLAAFFACFLLAAGYCYAMDLMRERLFIVALLGGLIGALSELVPVFGLDDNFVFPVLSATLLTGLFYVFGGL